MLCELHPKLLLGYRAPPRRRRSAFIAMIYQRIVGNNGRRHLVSLCKPIGATGYTTIPVSIIGVFTGVSMIGCHAQ